MTQKKRMTGHTPGPWAYAGNSLVRGPMLDGYAIADCGFKVASLPESERHANARLVAAAPDLLEALEALVKYGHPTYEGTERWVQEITQLENAAIAAIAKARHNTQQETGQ